MATSRSLRRHRDVRWDHEMVSVRVLAVCGCFFFFQAEDGIRDLTVTGVQTCALPISQLPHGARHAEQAVCPSSAQTPSWAVQCCKRHEGQTRTCSSHAGCSSTRHCAIPCSLQKSSAQTEQRDEHASQPQWSCRQITRAVGERPQCGHASTQPDPPLRDRWALNGARRPCADSSCHSARCIRTVASISCSGCTTALTWL